MADGSLKSLWVDVLDAPWENGVAGKRVTFNLVERLQPDQEPPVPPGVEAPPNGHERIYPRS